MLFPISGVEVSPAVPVLVGLGLALLTTPAGVSGAFLLLPFQVSVLGYVGPGVTTTNLLFNVISTPGAVSRYLKQGSLDWALVRAIAMGAVPGVVAGSFLRVTLLDDPRTFKAFVGVVLLLLGSNLFLQGGAHHGATRRYYPPARVTLFAAGAGLIGGIYGISGGSIIAPVLAGLHLSVRRVAPAALVATFITSVVGVGSYLLLTTLFVGGDTSAGPDWLLAVLFGLGGAIGGQIGARLNLRLPERALRRLLGLLAVGLGLSYLWPLL
jgi:uncharacterized membrane protein YfcA